jgi:hypothetical protein
VLDGFAGGAEREVRESVVLNAARVGLDVQAEAMRLQTALCERFSRWREPAVARRGEDHDVKNAVCGAVVLQRIPLHRMLLRRPTASITIYEYANSYVRLPGLIRRRQQ